MFITNGRLSISILYRTICARPPIALQELREKWERDDKWTYAISISVCNQYSLRFYIESINAYIYTHIRRHCCDPTLSPVCLKCTTEICTLTHCLWSCQKIQRHWSTVITETEKVLGLKLEMDPMSLILGLSARYAVLPNERVRVSWTSEKEPTVTGWHKVLFDLVPLEYLTYILHSRSNQFSKVWEPYLNYLDPDISAIMLQGFPERP